MTDDEHGYGWRDLLVVWRMRWLPYRTHEWIGNDFEDQSFGPAKWQWPDILKRPHRG